MNPAIRSQSNRLRQEGPATPAPFTCGTNGYAVKEDVYAPSNIATGWRSIQATALERALLALRPYGHYWIGQMAARLPVDYRFVIDR